VTRLINIDNGGTLTDVCIVDGDGVRLHQDPDQTRYG